MDPGPALGMGRSGDSSKPPPDSGIRRGWRWIGLGRIGCEKIPVLGLTKFLFISEGDAMYFYLSVGSGDAFLPSSLSLAPSFSLGKKGFIRQDF